MFRDLINGVKLAVAMLVGAFVGYSLSPISFMGQAQLTDVLPLLICTYGGALAGGVLWKLIIAIRAKYPDL